MRDIHLLPRCGRAAVLFLGLLSVAFFSSAGVADAVDLGHVKELIKVKSELKKHPGSVELHRRYQDLMIEDGWEEQIVTQYTMRRKKEGTPQNIYLLLRLKKEQKKADYKKLIEDFPDFSWGYFGLASMENESGNTERAKRLYEKVLALDGRNVPAYQLLASMYYKAGDPAKAIAVIKRGIKIMPESPGLLAYHGYYLGRLKRYPQALEVLNSALKIEPENELALRQLGFVLTNLGRDEDAAKAHRQYLSLWPSFGAIWANLCRNLLALYDKNHDLETLNESEKAWLKAIEVSPKDADVYAFLIDFFNDRNWWVHGLWFNNKALAFVSPKSGYYSGLMHNRDWIPAKKMGTSVYMIEAVRPLKHTGREDGLSASAIDHYNKGVLSIPNDLKKSVTELKAAIAIEPGWAEAHGALAVGYMMQKNYRDARKAIKTALELKPDDIAIQFNARLMKMFDEAVVQGTVKQLQEIAQGVKAGAGINLDSFEVFASPFERYLDRDPTSPEIYEAYGDIFAASPESSYWSSAIRYYRKAIELGGNKEKLSAKIGKLEKTKEKGVSK